MTTEWIAERRLALTMLRARVDSFTKSHGLTSLGGDDPGVGDVR